MADLPTVRWGIVATGMISEWFVTDLLKPDWPEKKANHIIQAIGSSSLDKCQKFADKWVAPAKPSVQPALYGSYQEIYDDPNVDCVYLGTPHSMHMQNCLDAIKAGKNVLCEKAFTLNTKQAEAVFAAAKEQDVFIMEAVWTRFYPLMKALQKFLHEDNKLGTIYRTFSDFGMEVDIPGLPEDSRYKDPALGAGTLLDIGIYSLTWNLCTLSAKAGEEAEDPEVASTQTISHSVDVQTQVLLHYPSNGRQGISTSTTNYSQRHPFARIEGSKGHIEVDGEAPSSPEYFIFYPKDGGKEERFDFKKPGRGFWWEADAVAQDLKAGRKQNATMPWAETLRVLKIFDGVRKRGGAKFPVDEW